MLFLTSIYNVFLEFILLVIFWVCIADHYSAVALEFDEITLCFQLPIVNIVKKTDQIVDIGGEQEML